MTKKRAESVARKLAEAGFKAEVRESYSGRKMFGEHTTAVVTDAQPNEHAATAGLSYDSMGKNDKVYY